MDIPYSQEFDDIYFSSEGGLDETKFVFIESNNLYNRWSNSQDPIFTICETGFGTGLNFLTTWKLWDEFNKERKLFNLSQKPVNIEEKNISQLRWLHFISTESNPLKASDIYRYLQNYSEISNQLKSFLDQYQLYTPGFYRFIFPSSKITLTLLYGDINSTLPELIADVDAWYLDGFAPSKNPLMWSDTLFSEMARLSRKDSSFATYTSASAVRKGLEAVGFSVQKKQGFGRKREMCFGQLNIEKNFVSNHESISKTKFKSKKPRVNETESLHVDKDSHKVWDKEFSIAGAGIAGASLTHAFLQREIKVKVYDPIGIAEEASGNPIGIFYPYLTKFPTRSSEISLSAFYFANQYLNSLTETQKQEIITQEGLYLRINQDEKALRYKTSLESHNLPKEVAKIVNHASLGECIYFPQAKTINPKEYVKLLLEDSEFIQEAISSVQDFESMKYSEPRNQKAFHQESCSHPIAYCTSYQITQMNTTKHLPIKKVRGQLYFSDEKDPIYSDLEQFKTAICADSYLARDQSDRFIVGSTFDEFKTEREWDANDEENMLSRLYDLISSQSKLTIEEIILARKKRLAKETICRKGNSIETQLYRISHRSQSRDRNPILGNCNGNWIFTALGSRGLVTSLLGGEILASLILKEPIPVPRSILQSLSPERYSNT